MKAIILAAGQGSRLRPLTNDVPKCMVKYNDQEIITYILSTMETCGIDDIAIVNGYKRNVLKNFVKNESVQFYTNEDYATTNMVSTLFSAESAMEGDLIISYADIIYSEEVLMALMESEGDFSVVVDENWRELWDLRMENPLADAETLRMRDGKIIELGKKASSYKDIEGQYIGLIKISAAKVEEFREYYHSLDKDVTYDGQDFDNMYMTSLIQMLIDNVMPVTPVPIKGGWLEIDSVDDLNAYEAKGLRF